MTVAACTIISKNYLPFARVLMDSVAAVHPDWQRHVLLVDQNDGHIDPAAEDFRLWTLDELPFEDLPHLLFKYTILEMNTAAKPWLLTRLLRQAGVDRAVYLDPDIHVYRPLTEVVDLLDGGATAVLTPHLLTPLPDDGGHPADRDILMSGSCNLGFLAVSRHPQAEALLAWWSRQSVHHFHSDVNAGLFTDQRWMDLAPAMFDRVTFLRHPGYNVAYWNLPTRRTEARGDGEVLVEGQPLVFFHYSGIDPSDPVLFSQHQDRYTRPALPAGIRELCRAYCEDLERRGFSTCAGWEYAYGMMRDGRKITAHHRRVYARLHPTRPPTIPDPFAMDMAIFDRRLKSTDHRLVTPLMLQFWNDRADLHAQFPDPLGRDELAFTRWFVNEAEERGIDRRHVEPVAVDLTRRLHHIATAPTAPTDGGACFRVAKLVGKVLPADLRQRVKRVLFPGRYQRAEAIEHARATRPVEAVRAPLQQDDIAPGTVNGFLPQLSWERAQGIGRLHGEALVAVPWRGRVRSISLEGIMLEHPDDKVEPLRVSVNGRPAGTIPYHTGPFSATMALELEVRDRCEITLHPPGQTGSSGSVVLLGCMRIDGRKVVDFSRDMDRRRTRRGSAVGVNVHGYLLSNTGVGQAARGLLAALATTDIPHVGHDLSHLTEALADERHRSTIIGEPTSGWTNLLHVNADEMPRVLGSLPAEVIDRGRRIGICYWELPEIPDRYLEALDHLDEIWAPTRFIQDAFAAKVTVPVVRIPPVVEFDHPGRPDRSTWNLPEDRFLFLVMYDMRSFQERKNPEAALEAYLAAFPEERATGLVIKCMHGEADRDAKRRLERLALRRSDVHLIDAELSTSEVHRLILSCDALVSLHRSEGFGLCLAEAMYLGRPVVATGWSGNTDFMDAGCALPVEYRLVEVGQDIGPYDRDQRWAEPDIDHAARCLGRLVADPALAARLGEAGRRRILAEHSAAAVGSLIRQRLSYVGARLPQEPSRLEPGPIAPPVTSP